MTLLFLLSSCKTHPGAQLPSIELTQVPPADPGGPGELDYIAGRVAGVTGEEQVVLYAHSGVWWIQPFANQQFTRLQPDLTWKNSTHLGTEYAALLVEARYRPLAKLAALPPVGNGVLAIATAKGQATAPITPKVVHFSGYDWMVRAAGSDRGGEPNFYDTSNAWTDAGGRLHLRTSERSHRWTCAEVSLTRSLGYGSYKFVIEDTGHLAPNDTLGLYTWDEGRVDDIRNELDIELSRWGKPESKNAQYVVQPFYVPENITRFNVPAGELTHLLHWSPGVAAFKTVRGGGTGPMVNEHVFTSSIPTPAGETVHMNLCDYHHSRNTGERPAEVVIEKFEYLP